MYFVTPNNIIVYFGAPETGNIANHYKLDLSELNPTTNELVFKKTVTLKATFLDFYKEKHPGFVPNEFYRTTNYVYIVDAERRNVLRIGDNNSGHLYKLKNRIKEVVTGPLASKFLIINELDELWDFGEKEPQKPLPNNIKVKCGGCWNTGFMIVDLENRIYFKDTTKYIRSGFGMTGTSAKLCQISSTDNYRIEKIRGGYFHVIMKTREGKIFCCGYDNFNQVSFGLMGKEYGVKNLTECPLEMGECIEFGGFSRGEYFLNRNNDVYAVGEMFNDFPIKPFEQFPFVQKFNLDELSTLARVGHLRFNDVMNAGWVCCFYHNPNKFTRRPSRIREKLLESAKNSKLFDVSITCLE